MLDFWFIYIASATTYCSYLNLASRPLVIVVDLTIIDVCLLNYQCMNVYGCD